MKKISAKGNFDRNYLYACLSLAGYDGNASSVRKVLYPLSSRTIATRLKHGDFSRVEMMKLARACNMDTYDFLRCFFTDLLREEDTRKYVLKEMLLRIMIDDSLDLSDEDSEDDEEPDRTVKTSDN